MMRKRAAAIVSLCVSLVLAFSAAAKNDKERWTPGQVIVKYKAGHGPETGKHGVKRAAKAFGKFKLKGKAQQQAAARGLDRVYVLELQNNDDVEAAVALLSRDPNVEYAEPNWRLELPAIPNDPRYASQWGLQKIGAPVAWDTATSGTGVVVGVVDTGIDISHPDLAANIWTNPGEIAGNGIDDDANGFVDDIHGWDFASDSNNVNDTTGHGTRVAGIIGAAGNNAAGGSGVVWTAKLAALRIGGSFPDVYAAVQAVEYANMMGFKVTNNSWGWWEGGQSFLLDDVVNVAEAAGYLFIAAAGNEAKDNDQLPTYPAHYENSNVISVTATTSTDELASFGNWGARTVDLGAPGTLIDSTSPGGTYSSGNGTSFSAPFVAGAAALYWTANPTATHVQVRNELLYTSQPIAALHGKSVTGGRLSLSNLFDPETTAPAAIGDLTILDTTFRSVVIRFTATGDDGAAGSASRYDVRVSTSPITEANFASAMELSGEPVPQTAGTVETFKLTGLASSTTYYIAVRAYDNAGNGSALSNVATFTTGRAAVLFDDNVENGPRGWTVAGSDGVGGPALWRIAQPYGKTNVWLYGKPTQYGYNYDTGARNWGSLTSPEIDLAQATDTRLRFRQFIWTERQIDREVAQVQISVDGGAWTTLMAKMFSLYQDLDETIDLSAYDGHRIRIRLFFDTIDGGANAYPGWQIDNFVIDASSTNAAPVANMNGPYSVTEDQAVTLSAAGSVDPEGAPLEYKWDFGDGSFAYTTNATVNHTWTRPGSYTLTLTAFDGSNSSDVVSQSISPVPVNDRPVAGISMAFATPPHLEDANIRVTWFDSSDEEGSPMRCRFDYGDGSPVIDYACEGSWTHAWSRPGTYTITLIVNDGQLDSLPDTEVITIQEAVNDRPVAVAGGPYTTRPNEPVTLDGSASSDEETSIASYLWTFPDGTTSTAAQPVKTFTTAGTHNVTLVVTDQTGLTSTTVTTQVRVCGAATANLFNWWTRYTCPGGTIKVGVDIKNALLPVTLTWSDGYVQQVTSLSGGYYAERVVSVTGPATYGLASITDALGCAGTVGSITNAVDLAAVKLAGGITTCAGQQQTIYPNFFGDKPWTLTWSDGYVQTVPVNDPGGRVVSPSATTTYSIISATSASCEPGSPAGVSGSFTINIIDPPVATLSGGGTSCNGGSVPLTVTITGGAPPYNVTFSDNPFVTYGANGSFTRNVSPSANTTYTITRIWSSSCNGTASGSATVNAGTRPSAVVSGGGSFCAGSAGVTVNAALTGTAPFTVVWSDGITETVEGNSTSRQVSPASTTTYTITSITAGGCSGTSSGSATATRLTLPTATVSGGGTSCNGAPVTITAALTGTGPWTVTWSDDVTQTISSGTTASRSVSPASTTTYTVTSVSNATCTGTSSGSATVITDTPPTATVSGGGTFCAGSAGATITAALTGTAPFTVTWSDSVVQTITSGNTASRTVAPASATVYTVTSISDAGCTGTSSGSATATRQAVPVATVSGGGTFCAGSAGVTITAALTGTAPFTVTWSDSVVQTIPSGNTASRTVAPASTTVYTVSSISDAFCSGTSSGSATATRKALPTATVSGGGAFCAGSAGVTITAALTGTAPFTVTWSDSVVQTIPSGNTASRTVAPASTTVYTVSSISDAFCSGTSTGSATATRDALPTATVSGDGVFCTGYPVTITASLTGTLPMWVNWSDGYAQYITSGNVASRQVGPAATTTYTVTSVSSGSCAGTSSGSATVIAAGYPNASVSGGGTFCEGSSVTITATVTAGVAPFTITWSDGVIQSIGSATTATRNVSPTVATTYTVSITDAYCTSVGSWSATATPTLKPVITQQPQNKTIARNTSTSINVQTTESGLNYQWYQGPTGTTTTPVGTNSPSFTTPKLRSTTQYWVKIWKASCPSYPTNSATATITVP